MKIVIWFSEREFEYDVFTLVKAFFPQDEVLILYDLQQLPLEFYALLTVDYSDGLDLYFKKKDQAGALEVLWSRHEPFEAGERTEKKNILKRAVYKGLSGYTKCELPWGTLTGIRPVKIVMNKLEHGSKNPEIADFMRQTYFTGNEKTALAISIANREREVLKAVDYKNGYSLYVGIPFCPSICAYCTFSSFPLERWKGRVEEYLACLYKELDYLSMVFKGKKLNTVYIGGGTPTTLEAGQLERLLDRIKKRFPFENVREFTVEAGRPDSITREKLDVMKKWGVSRISINPQTMNEKTLQLIGRRHTVEQIRNAYSLAKEMGFDNINMDLIAGLPGETEEDMERTLEEIKALSPDSLTIHSLAIKRAARLRTEKEAFTQYESVNQQSIMDMAARYAWEMGLAPYYLYRQKNMAGNLENIGYAPLDRLDKAGIYNILIMEELQTIAACGTGAITKAVFQGGKIERVDAVKDVDQYITRIDEIIEKKNAFFKKNGMIE